MKNACIAGVFYIPTAGKPPPSPCRTTATHPPYRTRFFCREQTATDTDPPAQDAFMHKPADHQPETAAIREKSGKRHRHPEHKPSAIPQSITSPDRSLPPAGYRHFTKPPVPATNGHFLHGCKRIRTGKTSGQTKRREKPGIRKYANRDRTIHHRLFRQCSDDRTFP